MNLDAFEKAAKDADQGIPAFLGEMMALAEAGKLTTFVAIYETNEDGENEDPETDTWRAVSYWTSPGTSFLAALGSAAFLRDAILNPREGDD